MSWTLTENGLKPDATINAQRASGTASDWFPHRADYIEPTPAARVRPEAQAIADKHAKSELADVIRSQYPRVKLISAGGSSSRTSTSREAPAALGPRVRTEEALAIAKKHTEQKDRWFDFEGNQRYAPTPRKPRITSAAGLQVYSSMTRPSSAEWFPHAGRDWRPMGFSLVQDPHEVHEAAGPRVADSNGREIALRMTRSQAKSWFPHEHKGRTPRSSRAGSARSKSGVSSSVDFDELSVRGRGVGVPSRTTPEGAEYAQRNLLGTAGWLATHATDFSEPPPPSRVLGDEANGYAQYSVAGSAMRAAFDHQTCKEVRFQGGPTHVLTDDAEDNLIRGRGLLTLGLSKSLTDVREEDTTPNVDEEGRPLPHNVVGADAYENLLANRGTMGLFLDQQKLAECEQEMPKLRLPSEIAQKQYERSRGPGASAALTDTAYPPPAPKRPTALAVTGDLAQSVAEKSRGAAVGELVTNMALEPLTPPPLRVTGSDVEQVAKLHQSGIMGAVLCHPGYGGPSQYAPSNTSGMDASMMQPKRNLTTEAQENFDRLNTNEIAKVLQMRPPTVRLDDDD